MKDLWGDAFLEVAHAKITPCFVKKFHDAGMSREFAGAVWACYKTNCTDMKEIPSLAEQHLFVQTLDTECTNDVFAGKDDQADS